MQVGSQWTEFSLLVFVRVPKRYGPGKGSWNPQWYSSVSLVLLCIYVSINRNIFVHISAYNRLLWRGYGSGLQEQRNLPNAMVWILLTLVSWNIDWIDMFIPAKVAKFWLTVTWRKGNPVFIHRLTGLGNDSCSKIKVRSLGPKSG